MTIAAALIPADLGERGQALWDALADGADPASAVLIAEACRIADRLERLSALLGGEEAEWARVQLPRGDDDELVLRIDGALTEARQQAQVLRQILGQLGLGGIDVAPQSGGSFLDDLARRRADRLADPETG